MNQNEMQKATKEIIIDDRRKQNKKKMIYE